MASGHTAPQSVHEAPAQMQKKAAPLVKVQCMCGRKLEESNLIFFSLSLFFTAVAPLPFPLLGRLVDLAANPTLGLGMG